MDGQKRVLGGKNVCFWMEKCISGRKKRAQDGKKVLWMKKGVCGRKTCICGQKKRTLHGKSVFWMEQINFWTEKTCFGRKRLLLKKTCRQFN